MKIGIRRKLVFLLVAVALLPLAAAAITIVIGWDKVRNQTMGQSLVSLTKAEALARQVSLTKDIQRAEAAMRDTTVVQTLAAPTTQLSPARLAQLDHDWPTMPLNSPPMAAVLHNPISNILHALVQEDPRIKEILVTDRFGQLVAANERSTDFYQADEDWWQEAYAQGKGRIFIPKLTYDESADAWSLEICVPIYGEDHQVIGIAKLVVDLARWTQFIEMPQMTVPVQLMMIEGDGVIGFREGVPPMSQRIADWYGDIANPRVSGWRNSHDEIQAFAPVHLPDRIGDEPVRMPAWKIVVYTPYSYVRVPILKVTAITTVIAVVVIIGIFLMGVFLIDRGLVRRLLRLNDAAAGVSRGDLNQRVRIVHSAGHPMRDEIDELIDGFNRMIEHVQHSTRALEAANELKTNFIRVASHELRTPVSYILGMARLLKDSSDAARLGFAVQSMGGKAKRLNEIIQAMFKLMPGEIYGQELQYSQVALSELLEEVYVDVFPFVEKRSQRLVIDQVDKIPMLTIDHGKIYDVLENLILNAIKFTPDGGIIKVQASLQLGDRVNISVQDQGAGIPESEYPRLFQPFYSGADVMTHSTGDIGYQKRGIGLGLAIVRHFVELHHGTVHVSSSPLGSTFSFSIPIAPPAEQEPEEEKKKPPEAEMEDQIW